MEAAPCALPVFLEEPGDPPVPWSDWISEFERHLNEESCPEEQRAARLLAHLGEEGRRILRSLPGPTDSYAEMVGALTAHYNAKQQRKKMIIAAATVGGALIGGVGAVVAAPFVLAGIGFTSTGIAAGSLAASMMSSTAIASGGGVAAGSLVAILQSAGAVGLSAGASAAVAGAGAAAGAAVAGTAGALGAKAIDGEDKDEDTKGMKKEEEQAVCSQCQQTIPKEQGPKKG
ncbi:interferon alpha-inducible protein 27-like protein 2B [Myripristis murdjan]|uniref:interferon alpha-inducible protein 27-like protein 2B n=1 Tax=Myripristis murdjan TaxID=586833 RepID=UPI00117608AB|nr:interferon alpha-inducible protein 27-like protein 2B [Myripristis murdjan]